MVPRILRTNRIICQYLGHQATWVALSPAAGLLSILSNFSLNLRRSKGLYRLLYASLSIDPKTRTYEFLMYSNHQMFHRLLLRLASPIFLSIMIQPLYRLQESTKELRPKSKEILDLEKLMRRVELSRKLDGKDRYEDLPSQVNFSVEKILIRAQISEAISGNRLI